MGLTTKRQAADTTATVQAKSVLSVGIEKSSTTHCDLHEWQLQDAAFFTYIAVVVGLLIAFGVIGGRFEPAGHLIGFHLLLAALAAAAIGLAAYKANPVTRFLRWWYPLLLCTFCFEAIGHMVHLIEPQLLDAQLVRADQYIFGTVLTPLLQNDSGWAITELMYFFYSSYYFLIPGIGFVLYVRCREAAGEMPPRSFREYIFAVSLTYWVCYLHFLFTPAGGPVFWADYPGPVREMTGGPITAIEQWVFNHGTIVGGAFPSSHVAVALVCAWFAIRCSIAPIFVVPVCIGLAISTIYAGYHYGVDVLYGITIGAVVTLIAGRLFKWRERSRIRQFAA